MRILHVIDRIKKVAGTSTFVMNAVEGLRHLGQDARIASDAKGLSFLDGHVDIVHIHGMWAPLLHKASSLAHAHGARVVWSVHGMTSPWALRHRWWKKLPAWFLFQKRDLQKAHLLHVTTRLEADWNRQAGLKNPQVVVPLGTDLPDDEKMMSRVEEKGVTGQRELRVLFVGRIHPVKGLSNLIEAMGQMKDVPISLRVVGPDQDGHRAELEALAWDVGVTDHIEWIGPRYGDGLAVEYAHCDVLVLPSHTENFGGVVVDAMAYGKPVIASRHTPWEELVTRQCGWWVGNAPEELALALREMGKLSSEDRVRLGTNGRRWVEEEFTWSKVVNKLLESYQGLLRVENLQ